MKPNNQKKMVAANLVFRIGRLPQDWAFGVLGFVSFWRILGQAQSMILNDIVARNTY